MKTLFLASALALGIASSPLAQAPAGANEVEQTVKQLQQTLIDAYIHRDMAALDRILAPDYMFIDDLGTLITKAQMIASFQTGERKMGAYRIDDQKVRVYGDAAVMTYRYTSEEQYQGKDDSGERQLTRVFAKRNGQWQMVSGHETRIARP